MKETSSSGSQSGFPEPAESISQGKLLGKQRSHLKPAKSWHWSPKVCSNKSFR